jgi:hypothetical protein
MRRNKFLLYLIFVAIVGCKKDYDAEKTELIDYVKNEDNGFAQTKEINGVKINLTYRPTDLMVSQEMSNYGSEKKINLDSIKNKYKRNIYFVLSYSRDNKEILSTISSSREDFNAVQKTLTFDMLNKVSLINQDKDTIRIIDYNFPRTYGMSRATSLLFIFERNEIIEKSKDLLFNIQDIGLGTGDLKFKYPADLINNN